MVWYIQTFTVKCIPSLTIWGLGNVRDFITEIIIFGVFSAGLLFGYDPSITVGRDGKPRKQHLIQFGKQYYQMLYTLINEVQWATVVSLVLLLIHFCIQT